MTPPATTTPVVIKASSDAVECYCVRFLRERLGVNVRGDAETLIPNVTDPQPGDVVLLRYRGISHAALIERIEGNELFIHEANYRKCTESLRIVAIGSPEIKGYLRP